MAKDKFTSDDGKVVARVVPHPFVDGYTVLYDKNGLSFMTSEYPTKAAARAKAKAIVRS